MLITSLDYSSYTGRIAVGRVHRGTLKEGMRLNVSRERARQIKEKGLRHLREASEETHLKTYLG